MIVNMDKTQNSAEFTDWSVHAVLLEIVFIFCCHFILPRSVLVVHLPRAYVMFLKVVSF